MRGRGGGFDFDFGVLRGVFWVAGGKRKEGAICLS